VYRCLRAPNCSCGVVLSINKFCNFCSRSAVFFRGEMGSTHSLFFLNWLRGLRNSEKRLRLAKRNARVFVLPAGEETSGLRLGPTLLKHFRGGLVRELYVRKAMSLVLKKLCGPMASFVEGGLARRLRRKGLTQPILQHWKGGLGHGGAALLVPTDFVVGVETRVSPWGLAWGCIWGLGTM
jgi:putative component of toxin-antitoxin plasmid stabilization module